MSIGALRQRITIEQEQQVADGAGGYALSWAEVATVWAEVEPQAGREVFFAGGLQTRVTHIMTLRYRTGLTAGMRVNYDNRLFNIRGVANVGERDRFIRLFCEEGVAT